MRSSYVVMLCITLFGSGVYFYTAYVPTCNVPMTYRLGSLDARFNLTPGLARAYLAEAEQVWEKAAGHNVFDYDESSAFPVNFIFDDRQERTIAEEAQRQSLDQKESTSASIASEYKTLSAKYATLKTAYEKAKSDYEARLDSFNAKVADYNASGGAPEDAFAALKAEEKALAATADALQNNATELATLAKNINTLSEQGNRLIAQYNAGVAEYNTHFGGANEFTQGDYQGKNINIYKFSTHEELVRVLTHEFGHALGLGHVEGTTSIMYYLMEKQPQFPVLSTEDRTALNTVCNDRTALINSLYRPIHTLLASLLTIV